MISSSCCFQKPTNRNKLQNVIGKCVYILGAREHHKGHFLKKRKEDIHKLDNNKLICNVWQGHYKQRRKYYI